VKDTVKVYKKGHAYLGTKAEKAGFIGEVGRMFNFYTMTLIRPGTSAQHTIDSLEVQIADLRMRAKEEEKSTEQQAPSS